MKYAAGGRYSVFPSGELHIRHVTQADGALAYRCETSHLLTGELRLSAAAGRLLVTSPQSSVPPRITDSRSHVQARYRQPVELPCAAQGFPLPTYTAEFRNSVSPSELDFTYEPVHACSARAGGSHSTAVARAPSRPATGVGAGLRAEQSGRVRRKVDPNDVLGIVDLRYGWATALPRHGRVTLAAADGEQWYRSAEGRSQPVFQGGGSRVRQVGGSLYVTGALLQDSGRYVCVVNNSVGVERASTSLLVTTPLSAYTVPQQQTVDVGRPAQLNCSTAGHPQLAVSWLKDGRPLRTSARVALLSPQTLLIERVERSDRGMYQCVVSNNEETAQGTAEIRLGDSSPALLSGFSGATLQPGAAWSAECEAAGSPLPSVSWLLDGQPLRSSAVPGERRVEVTVQAGGVSVRGRLSLSGVRTTDAGVYECVASNAAGEARHAAPLHVLGPPHVRPMRDARLVAREDAAFHCRVTGYPISEIHWEREVVSLLRPAAAAKLEWRAARNRFTSASSRRAVPSRDASAQQRRHGPVGTLCGRLLAAAGSGRIHAE
ncbi:Down syndrome cell adhesion molecule-like protein Dscam2 [Schistocerca nitens]|uniref:Down syndrome cell adhesion molecule-like protein Dscam2 n=1 Tax=Schistocerca nitens TaxID=7011 RepID=UPI002118A9FF|nr:Down syndrome cell adhesion molecule-like protein Dscam2 [Schistocerca nitens]